MASDLTQKKATDNRPNNESQTDKHCDERQAPHVLQCHEVNKVKLPLGLSILLLKWNTHIHNVTPTSHCVTCSLSHHR